MKLLYKIWKCFPLVYNLFQARLIKIFILTIDQITHLKRKSSRSPWWSHLCLPVTFLCPFSRLCLLPFPLLLYFIIRPPQPHSHTNTHTHTHTHHLKSPKVNLFNLNWHNRYWILLRTSNEYGYTYTHKRTCVHVYTHTFAHTHTHTHIGSPSISICWHHLQYM